MILCASWSGVMHAMQKLWLSRLRHLELTLRTYMLLASSRSCRCTHRSCSSPGSRSFTRSSSVTNKRPAKQQRPVCGGCERRGICDRVGHHQFVSTLKLTQHVVQDEQHIRLLEVKQQRASLELEVEKLKAAVLPAAATCGAEADAAAIIASIE